MATTTVHRARVRCRPKKFRKNISRDSRKTESVGRACKCMEGAVGDNFLIGRVCCLWVVGGWALLCFGAMFGLTRGLRREQRRAADEPAELTTAPTQASKALRC